MAVADIVLVAVTSRDICTECSIQRLSPKDCRHVEESSAVNRMGGIPAKGLPMESPPVLTVYTSFMLSLTFCCSRCNTCGATNSLTAPPNRAISRTKLLLMNWN